MWSEPEEPNGEITGYDVLFGDYGDYSGHTMESVRRAMKKLMDLCKCEVVSMFSTYIHHFTTTPSSQHQRLQ